MSTGALSGRVAIVTGGASGIGAATVERFVDEGASVLIADLDDLRGPELAAVFGDRVSFRRVDVSNEDDVAAMVLDAHDRFGRLDVVFNNAGFGGALGPIATTSVADFDLTFDVLVKSVFLGMKHAAPVLMEQGSGSIINTASIAALRAGWSPHLYAAAKAAVLHLTSTVAMELAAAGVRCNTICPGFIATPLAYGRPGADETDLARLRAEGGSVQPLGRVGEPADVASMALFLASDESTWITGQQFVVDGGLSAGAPWSQFSEQFTRARPIRHHRPPDR